jgi:hypothetical protein
VMENRSNGRLQNLKCPLCLRALESDEEQTRE